MPTDEMINVVLFSGGRTSGYMLRRLLDSESFSSSWWKVIFCNTGKEREETLEFVHEVETRWNVPVVWLEYHRVLASSITPGIFPTNRRNQNLAKAAEANETTHWFKVVDFKSASRKGEPFDELLEWMSVLPNVVSRGCSIQLKIRTAMRFLFRLGVKEYSPILGIRKDEEHRATQILSNCDSFEHPKFPLIEENITESDIDRYWSKESSFDLNLKSYEGNCDLCFLKARWKRVKLVREHPGMVDWWKNWESKKANIGNGSYFRLNESYSELELEAKRPAEQEFCLFGGTEDIPCSCAEKGFGGDDE